MTNQRKKFGFGVALAAALSVLLAIVSSAGAIVLVRDGKPLATIVVAPDASAQIQQAAQTLQQYVQQCSGATLPIAFAPSDGATIYIGQSDATKSAGIDTKGFDQDGFLLQAIDEKSYCIIGGNDWGTEFGVYDFLERYLGVRWLMPTDLGTDVPHHITIDIPATKVVQQPTYISRELSPVYITSDSDLGKWGRFNRARGRISFSHNLLHIFPVSKFGKTHPEFYPMINGKRYIPNDDKDELNWQPNFSAPGIVDAAVEQIEKYFQENLGETTFSLGMNDSNGWDQSAASKARRNGKINYLGLEHVSDDCFTWANAVVAKVLLKYPDKWFGTLAYRALAEPPTKVTVNPHIIPFITYDRMHWEDSEAREFGHQLTERWEKVSPVLGWYDYIYGASYLVPRFYPHQMQQYFSWGAAHHVKYSYAELYPNWGEGPKPWIATKLLWNPNQNVDDLLNDWYVHFAGAKAAPKLKDYYAIWEKFWTVDISKSKWNVIAGQTLPFYDPSYLLDVPESYITQSDADMQAASRLADTPQRKARVAKLNAMWEFYKNSILTYQGMNLASATAPQSEALTLALIDKAEKGMSQIDKRQKLLTSLQNDPLFAENIKGISAYPAIFGQNWGSGSPLLWRALPWVKKSSAVKERLLNLTKNLDSAIGQQANQILQAADGKFSLISSNPSFEDGEKGWTTWDKADQPIDPAEGEFHKGTWGISAIQKRSDTRSFLVKGVGRGALLQHVPYQPGTYFATAHCYVPQDSKKASVKLTLQAYGPKGELLGDKFTLPTGSIPLQAGVWADITIPFTLPQTNAEKAASVRIMVELNHFDPNDEIYLDDVGIYRMDD